MRMTRAQAAALAAAEAEAEAEAVDHHSDGDVTAPVDRASSQERAPLGEITSNSVDGEVDGGVEEKLPAKGKGRRTESRSRSRHAEGETDTPIAPEGNEGIQSCILVYATMI